MGLELKNLQLDSDADVAMIRHSLLENGVVVLRSSTPYQLSRKDQVDFTQKLGDVIKLPASFAGNDPEPVFSEIQRVTNYWSNGTFKGPQHCFGCYWHKDGNFQHNDYLASILYADEVDGASLESTGTWFLDNSATYGLMENSLKHAIDGNTMFVSVTDIPDFQNGSEEDYALFPIAARHNVFYKHPGNNRDCVYLTGQLITEKEQSEGQKKSLEKAWEFMTEASPLYKHEWKKGDIVIWDNLAVMHRRSPKVNSDTISKSRRMMFRTQCHLGKSTRGKYGGSTF